MWISRAEFDSLKRRIESLESSAQKARNDINENGVMRVQVGTLYSHHRDKPLKEVISAILRHLGVELSIVHSTPERIELRKPEDFYPVTLTGVITDAPKVKRKAKSRTK